MISSSTKIYSPVVNLELPALDAVGMLFQALHAQSIRYVHWKSNIRLDLSLQGGTDLDLLVDREQSQAFRQILMEQDIKPILPPAGQRYPAMEHYLGFDPASGKLFHLHIHYQLILGEEYIKNFRLPLEEQFLSQVRSLYGVITPVPELEIIILSIRVLLKYRDRDALKDILSIRSAGNQEVFSPRTGLVIEPDKHGTDCKNAGTFGSSDTWSDSIGFFANLPAATSSWFSLCYLAQAASPRIEPISTK